MRVYTCVRGARFRGPCQSGVCLRIHFFHLNHIFNVYVRVCEGVCVSVCGVCSERGAGLQIQANPESVSGSVNHILNVLTFLPVQSLPGRAESYPSKVTSGATSGSSAAPARPGGSFRNHVTEAWTNSSATAGVSSKER